MDKINVFFDLKYAGTIERESNDNYSFVYDETYLKEDVNPISKNLPLRSNPFINKGRLHSFFDNLISEGWLKQMQMETMNIHKEDKFQLLKNFGFDLAGAVYIEPNTENFIPTKKNRYSDLGKIRNHASISGIQKKILIIKENNNFRPTISNKLSTHIAKLESDDLDYIIELEYLSNLAMKKLLPNDVIVDVEIVDDLIDYNNEKKRALIVTRFDRENNNRIHFEEFNQLLDKFTEDKYSFSYEDMGNYILNETSCSKDEVLKLYQRILACFLIGNTDAHLKNFAIYNQNGILKHQTPMYDVVYSSYYKEFKTIALKIGGCKDLEISEIKPKHIINLGMNGFKLEINDIITCVNKLLYNIDKAVEEVNKSPINVQHVKDNLIQMMIKRRNGTFSGVQNYALKKKSLKH